MTGMCRTGVALVPALLSVACSPNPQNHPVATAPIPANVRISEECSTLGRLMCGAVSMLSGDGGAERRSACIAYTEQSGRRVEQCGSISASQTSSLNVSSNPSEPTKAARLSWKDNSDSEDGFRVYRLVGNISHTKVVQPTKYDIERDLADCQSCRGNRERR